MFEDEVLKEFLEKAYEDAKKEIKEKGILTIQSAIPLLLKSQYNHITHLDEEVTTIKEDIKEIKNIMATKDDIKNMATKDDIKNMATKDDIKNMATKDDINILKDKIKDINHWIMFGVGILAIFIPAIMTIIIKFVK